MNPDQLSRRLEEALLEIDRLNEENRSLKEVLDKAKSRVATNVAADISQASSSPDTAST